MRRTTCLLAIAAGALTLSIAAFPSLVSGPGPEELFGHYGVRDVIPAGNGQVQATVLVEVFNTSPTDVLDVSVEVADGREIFPTPSCGSIELGDVLAGEIGRGSATLIVDEDVGAAWENGFTPLFTLRFDVAGGGLETRATPFSAIPCLEEVP